MVTYRKGIILLCLIITILYNRYFERLVGFTEKFPFLSYGSIGNIKECSKMYHETLLSLENTTKLETLVDSVWHDHLENNGINGGKFILVDNFIYL